MSEPDPRTFGIGDTVRHINGLDGTGCVVGVGLRRGACPLERDAALTYGVVPNPPAHQRQQRGHLMETMPNVGDRVAVNHSKYPGVWVVVKVDKVNVVLEPEAFGGRRLRCSPGLLIDPDATPPPTRLFDVGEFVRLEGKFAGLYVVIKDSGDDKVNLAIAGGNGGRYVRALRGNIIRVDAAEVLRNDWQVV